MHSLPKLFLAVVVTAATPAAALAQSWPASVVAAGPRMAPAPAQALVRVEDGARLLPQPHDAMPSQLRLKLSAVEIDDIPDVDIRAKDDWSDDQGLRVGPTRLAFKRRF